MRASLTAISAMATFVTLTEAAALATAPASLNVTLGRRQDRLTAQFTLGSQALPFATYNPVDEVLCPALEDLCKGDNGCDNGRKWSMDNIGQFNGKPDPDPDGLGCVWSVEAEGNYDKPEERDYMANLMYKTTQETQIAKDAESPIRNTICPPACEWEPGVLYTAMNYIQVVLNQPDGANTGSLQVRMSLNCKDETGFDCPGIVKDNLKDALSAVPGVGNIIAQVFDFTCA